MRHYIRLIEGLVLEGATIYPARMGELDGEPYVSWPDEFVAHKEIPCRDCEGTGESRGIACPYCRGTKIEHDTEHNFPEFSAGYATIRAAAALMGLPEEEHGWVPREQLPEVRRRLIRLKNGGVSDFAQDAVVEKGRTRVDRSSNIPKITSGPTMYDFGISEYQIMVLIDRLLGIIDWAQKHNCGIGWA